jgi:hypothetical protein
VEVFVIVRFLVIFVFVLSVVEAALAENPAPLLKGEIRNSIQEMIYATPWEQMTPAQRRQALVYVYTLFRSLNLPRGRADFPHFAVLTGTSTPENMPIKLINQLPQRADVEFFAADGFNGLARTFGDAIVVDPKIYEARVEYVEQLIKIHKAKISIDAIKLVKTPFRQSFTFRPEQLIALIAGAFERQGGYDRIRLLVEGDPIEPLIEEASRRFAAQTAPSEKTTDDLAWIEVRPIDRLNYLLRQLFVYQNAGFLTDPLSLVKITDEELLAAGIRFSPLLLVSHLYQLLGTEAKLWQQRITDEYVPPVRDAWRPYPRCQKNVFIGDNSDSSIGATTVQP